jgi:hypothetical protein
VCCKLDVTDLEMTGLAHLYSALERSVLLPAIMEIRTHPISFASRPWKVVCAAKSHNQEATFPPKSASWIDPTVASVIW